MIFKKFAAGVLSAIMAISAFSVVGFADSYNPSGALISTYDSSQMETVEWNGKTDLDYSKNHTVSKKITVSGQYSLSSTLTIKKGGSITLNKDASLLVSTGGKIVIEKGGKITAKKGSGVALALGGAISNSGTADFKSGSIFVSLYSTIEITKGGKFTGKGIAIPLITETSGKGKSTLTGLYVFKSVSKSQAKAYVKPVNTLITGMMSSDLDKIMTAAMPSSVYKKLKSTLKASDYYDQLSETLQSYKESYLDSEESINDVEFYISGYAKLSSTAKKNYIGDAEDLLKMAGSKLKVTDARAVQVGIAYAGDDDAYAGQKYDAVINLVIVKIDGNWYLSSGYLVEINEAMSSEALA